MGLPTPALTCARWGVHLQEGGGGQTPHVDLKMIPRRTDHFEVRMLGVKWVGGWRAVGARERGRPGRPVWCTFGRLVGTKAEAMVREEGQEATYACGNNPTPLHPGVNAT